ncbi:MAG: hypothetical protein O3A95_08200 [Planctomycetota bacterium]|nr:hypothetical protein [Planctomycetota bacterium]MDA1114264.1 hypothetical protein [Planctomycetota bacterium]
MNESPLLLAIDQATTSSRAVLFRVDQQPIRSAQWELAQSFPQPAAISDRHSGATLFRVH